MVQQNKNPENKAIIYYGKKKASKEFRESLKNNNIYYSESDVSYEVVDSFKKYWNDRKELKILKLKKTLFPPCILEFRPEWLFRTKKPAILGCKVLHGKVIIGTELEYNSRVWGKIASIQYHNKEVSSASEGEEISISLNKTEVTKSFLKEKKILYTYFRDIAGYSLCYSSKKEQDIISLILKTRKEETTTP